MSEINPSKTTCENCDGEINPGHECPTTAGRPLQEPYTYFTEQVVLNGQVFGSQIIVTVRLTKRGGLYKGDAERSVWRTAWSIARMLDTNKAEAYGIKNPIRDTGIDSYVLDEEASTIENDPIESLPVRELK